MFSRGSNSILVRAGWRSLTFWRVAFTSELFYLSPKNLTPPQAPRHTRSLTQSYIVRFLHSRCLTLWRCSSPQLKVSIHISYLCRLIFTDTKFYCRQHHALQLIHIIHIDNIPINYRRLSTQRAKLDDLTKQTIYVSLFRRSIPINYLPLISSGYAINVMKRVSKVALWGGQDGVCAKTHLNLGGRGFLIKKGEASHGTPQIKSSGVRVLFPVFEAYIHGPLFILYTTNVLFPLIVLSSPSIWSCWLLMFDVC